MASSNGLPLLEGDSMSNPIGKFSKTNRGFGLVEFTDSNGVKCSIQQSSLATQNCLWIGCSTDYYMQLSPGKGWEKVEIAQNQLVNDKMHLNESQVRQLVARLEIWLETGSLKKGG